MENDDLKPAAEAPKEQPKETINNPAGEAEEPEIPEIDYNINKAAPEDAPDSKSGLKAIEEEFQTRPQFQVQPNAFDPDSIMMKKKFAGSFRGDNLVKKEIFPRWVGYTVGAIVAAGLISLAGYYWYQGNETVRDMENDTKVSQLENKIKSLEGKVKSVTTSQEEYEVSINELQNRQEVRQKSQDDLLTTAVSKVSPSVVSIVISKEVPNLEVVYKNPFGDDPFFKNFGFQIPVYQQKGTIKKKIGAGTGFIISSDGYILTNKHVVYDTAATYTVLMSNGSQKDAAVIYRDDKLDVALVKIEGNGFRAAALGNSGSLKLGQTVVAIGNALGEYNNSVSVGIISGLDRSITASSPNGSEELTGVIQTDAGINPGNSGGPLINLSGEVVGINVATVQGSNSISFSIPINQVKPVIGKK